MAPDCKGLNTIGWKIGFVGGATCGNVMGVFAMRFDVKLESSTGDNDDSIENGDNGELLESESISSFAEETNPPRRPEDIGVRVMEAIGVIGEGTDETTEGDEEDICSGVKSRKMISVLLDL